MMVGLDSGFKASGLQSNSIPKMAKALKLRCLARNGVCT